MALATRSCAAACAVATVAAFACAPTSAQSLALERIDGRDGLPHNLVQALQQDKTGFLWIGTIGGLARFDGTDFRVFRHRPTDPNSLSSSAIHALALASDESLWVGTADGLNRYVARTQAFEHVSLPDLPDSTGSSVTSAGIAGLAPDSSGNVWAVTFSGQLYRAAPGINQADRIEMSVAVTSVAVDASGTVWITTRRRTSETRESIRRLRPGENDFEHVATTKWTGARNSLGVFSDGSGGVWLRSPGDRSLCYGELPEGELPPCLPALGGERISALARDSTMLWMGGPTGIAWLRHDRRPGDGPGSWQPIVETPDAWLSNNTKTLFVDRSGTLWIGTLSGLYRYDPHRRPFVEVDLASSRDRRDGAVMAMHVDVDGTVWAGTLGRGFVRVNPDGSVQSVASPGAGLIWGLAVTDDNTIWAGLAEDGLCAFDRGKRAFECYDIGAALIATSRSGLWVAGSEIVRFDVSTKQVIQRLDWPSSRPAVGGALLESDDETLWVAADGLYQCGKSDDCIRPLAQVQTDLGLDRVETYALFTTADGVLWMATTRGLASYDADAGFFRAYFDRAPVEGLILYSIVGDQSGSLWFGSSKGLVRFDRATETFRVYDPDARPGLPEYNRRASFVGSDGRIYLGHLDGYSAFDPASIRSNPNRPPIVLVGVTLTDNNGPKSLGVGTDQHLELSYRDRLIRFDFAALNFTHPEENRYRYRLVGFDNDWVDAGTDRFASYTNLPPGQYEFRVQGSNNDGLWSTSYASARMVVSPPVWVTWWFRAIAVFVLAALLFGAHRYRVAQLLRVERIRSRIAGDLHDEVGSKLAALALSSETLARRANLASGERRRLSEMADIARRMADDLRDIVWLANPRFDTFGDLIERMRTTADALLGQTSYTFSCDDSDAVRALDVEQRRQLFLFYKETLRNIARHAKASRVVIRLDCTSESISLDVTDDGCGFDRSGKPQATGLATLDERARALGGVMRLVSAPGEGTSVRLLAPLERMAFFRDGAPGAGYLRSEL